MGLRSFLGRSEGDAETEEETESPSHVCRDCGEEYYAHPDTEIKDCRTCGGINVEAV